MSDWAPGLASCAGHASLSDPWVMQPCVQAIPSLEEVDEIRAPGALLSAAEAWIYLDSGRVAGYPVRSHQLHILPPGMGRTRSGGLQSLLLLGLCAIRHLATSACLAHHAVR